MAKTPMKKEADKPERQHRASYARDKLNGGWLVRVEGPNAGKFAGREVPVLQFKTNKEQAETLKGLIWKGMDEETGKPVALYAFEPKPKEELSEAEF